MRACGLFSLMFSVAMGCAVLSCSAADIYIAQTTQGSDTGADPSDAHSIAWLNNSSNWGSGANQVYNGTTVHFCGTITNSLTMPQGGVPGNPITLYFEPNAKFSAPTWTGTIITAASYVTIDGGSNGLIEATANGTGLTYSNNITGISLAGCSDVTVQNLTIQNLYVNLPGADEHGSAGAGIYASGVGMSYITVTNCVLHDIYQGFMVVYSAGCSNITMTHCTAYHCNWGGAAGDANSSATLNGLMVDHNHFYSWSNWDDTLDYDHHNGFYGWAESGGWVSNVTFTANYVGPGYGAHNSSGMFVSGKVHAFEAYNNIFDASDGTSPADAQLYVSNDSLTTNLVMNNTFIMAQGVSFYGNPGGDPTYWRCYNNEFYSNSYAIEIWYDNNTKSSHITDTNNFYGNPQLNASGSGSGNIIPLGIFQSYGFDKHSATGNPNLGAGFVPGAGSALLGAGANFSGVFATDYASNTRPASGAWTIGAYQVGGSVAISGAEIAISPTNLNFGILPAGATTNQTFTVSNIGSGTLTGTISVTAPYAVVSGGSYSLNAGQSQPVTISYSPMVVGTNTQTAVLSGGGGASALLTGLCQELPPVNLQAHSPGP